MKIPALGAEITVETKASPTITITEPLEYKRPIGFARWSTSDEKPPRKPRKRSSAAKVAK